jgi:ankyrin repeat protein
MADMLAAKCPSAVNTISSVDGSPLLHAAAANKLDGACFFLVSRGADVDSLNRDGESPLHIACQSGMASLTSKLLEKGADPDVRTPPPPFRSVPSPVKPPPRVARTPVVKSNPFDDDEEEEEEETAVEVPVTPVEHQVVGMQTALHFAINGGFEDNVLALVEYAE